MTNPQILVGSIIGLLTLIGSGVGWYVNRRDKQKDPIPKTAAELAVAQTALGIIDRSAARLDRDNARMGSQIDKQQEQLDDQQSQIDSQQEQINTIKALLSHAARYIETLLRAWPPEAGAAPAVPAPLDELIDATLHPKDSPHP